MIDTAREFVSDLHSARYQAKPYLDMGVRHFCMGGDVGILLDWFIQGGLKGRTDEDVDGAGGRPWPRM